MAFQKKGSKWWYVTVREPGTSRVKTLKASTPDEADALALEYRAKKKRGSKDIAPIVGISPTFRDLAVEHLQGLKAATAKNELYYVNQIYVPLFGNKPIEYISKSDLRAAMRVLQERGLKQNTIKRRMGFLSAILNRAVKNGLLEVAPIIPVSCGKDDVIIPPSKTEVKSLLDHAPAHLFRAILLAAHTGLRAGKAELLAISWADIDFSSEVIRVTSAKKGGLPWREIPIAPALLPYLKLWAGKDESEGITHVVNYQGKQVGDIKKSWATAKKNAKITRRLRMYDLRHSFITEIMSAGVDLATAAYLAGHADPATTARVYRHIQAKDTVEAVKKISAIGDYTSDYNSPQKAKTDYKKSQ